MAKTVVGIDVGGTFTDIAILTDGRLEVHKLPSTPEDPAEGFLQGVAEAVPTKSRETDFVHGSTVATNALLEGKGGRTALVTTMGFEDVLEIGRQSRAELYNLDMDRVPALAPWELRFGLPERVDHTGTIVEDLSQQAIETLVSLLEEARGRRRGRLIPVLFPQSSPRRDVVGSAAAASQCAIPVHLQPRAARVPRIRAHQHCGG